MTAFFKKLLDLGDFIAVTGRMVRTKTGEISVEARQIQLLSKTLEAMPDKWHGVKDIELRYRRRYVDLMVNPEVRQVFVTRAKMVQAIREYLDTNGFIEVETPVLQPIYGGAAARPFTTFHNQLKQDLYLRISFELYLKRLLVGGLERVYEIGRDFRNEGVSFKHNPEFTQLEWYEAYTDYNGVMRRVEDMLAHVAMKLKGSTTLVYQGHEIDLAPPWRRVTLREAILQYAGIDYTLYPTAEGLAAAMRATGPSPREYQQPRQADQFAAGQSRRAESDPADICDGLSDRDQPAGQEDSRRSDHRGALRVFHRRARDGQRLHRA